MNRRTTALLAVISSLIGCSTEAFQRPVGGGVSDQLVACVRRDQGQAQPPIGLNEVARLGGADGDALLADNMGETLVRDDGGKYWLWSYRLSTQLWQFGTDGTAELIGQEGRGPREFNDVGVNWTIR